jgi:hypothetical protein
MVGGHVRILLRTSDRSGTMLAMRTLIAAIAMALALSACGDDSEPKVDAAPAPVAATATVSQFASAFAGADLPEAIEKAQEACGLLMESADAPICGVTALTLEYTATGLVGKLEDLGQPPAEIAALVDATLLSAAEVRDAAAGFDEDHAPLMRAMMGFPGDEWAPYL